MFRKSTTNTSRGRYFIAIRLRDVKELFLRRIDGLALYVAGKRPVRQHVGDAGQLAVALVDVVSLVTRDHEKGDPVANFGGPNVLLVKAEIDGGFRWIVPDKTIAAAGDEEGNANVLSAHRPYNHASI